MNKSSAGLIVGLAALVALPFFYREPYHLHILVLILIWSFAYTSWSMMGRFGLVSLGHGGFMGIGAYVTALLWNHLGLSPWLGIPLAIGSDGPLNPFLNLQFAVTHPDNPREALTREQAVVAYTRGSAYAEHAERVKGTLAPGFLADLAILSQDIFAVPDDRLPETVSVMTIVGGRIAYDTGVLSPGGASGAARPTRPPR